MLLPSQVNTEDFVTQTLYSGKVATERGIETMVSYETMEIFLTTF